jgi:hypothetical protein
MEAEPPEADPPKRKLGWFQFSLRTLMIVVTMFCVIGGDVASQEKIVQERQLMIRRVKDHDGYCLIATKDAGTSLSADFAINLGVA